MRKIDLSAFKRKIITSYYNLLPSYTLAEIVIVMLIIAVVVAVSIGINKAKLDNIVSYTYYSAYSSLRSITSEILAEFDSKSTDYTDTALNFHGLKFFENLNIITYLISNSVSAETARLYKCPDYQASSGAYYSPGENFAVMTGNNGIVEGKPDTSGLQCSYNDVIDYLKNDYNMNICTSKRADGYTTYGNCTCDCTQPLGIGGTATCKVVQTGVYTCGSSSIANVPSCQDSGYSLQGSYCVHEYECPTDTYPYYIEQNNGWYTYSCQQYTTCPDGSKIKQGETCADTCTPPSELEQKRQYCAHGYSNFNTSPDICDYIEKPASWPPTCQEGYVWNNDETDCKCVPTPKTLPRKGENFCKLFEGKANTMSGVLDDFCSGSAITSSTTDFSDKTPDLVLRNGLRLYNMHVNATQIEDLIGNTQGGSYDGVDNTNVWGYTVYVDIDGEKGDSLLWSDVYPFYITLSGKVIPAYDTSNLQQSGGDSVKHLQVSVERETYDSGKRRIDWVTKSVSFKEGACLAGYVGSATQYCKSGDVYSLAPECSDVVTSPCTLKKIQPVKFFF